MTCSWQLHNITVRNVSNAYQKDIFYCSELPDDLGTISCFTDTHILIHQCLPHWGLQITLSSQSYNESLAYTLHPKGFKKFELSPISSPIRKSRICLIYSRTDKWKQRNYRVNSLCGILLQQGHFASTGNKSIMIYSLMWRWCSVIDISTAWRRL
jgi:hypothetical protein